MEERLRCRREQYKLRRDRKTPEEEEKRRRRNRECLRCRRAAITAEQRRLVRTRNVQISTSTWGLMCIITHSLIWTSYLSWQASLECHWHYLLRFQQQQRGSAHWHALALINHGDASDGEHISEWDWRSISENDDQDDDEYCTVQWWAGNSLTTPVNYIILIIVIIVLY